MYQQPLLDDQLLHSELRAVASDPTVTLLPQYDHLTSVTHVQISTQIFLISNPFTRICAFAFFYHTQLSYCLKASRHVDWCSLNNIRPTKRVTKPLSLNFWKSTRLSTPSADVDTDLQRRNEQVTVDLF